MTRKPPSPFCKAFLVCHEIHQNPENGSLVLVGWATSWQNSEFPAAMPAAIFARLSSGHGDYTVEIQLKNAQGEALCRAAVPEPVALPSPLEVQDATLEFSPVFPAPGDYSFVLTANGDELDCMPFQVRLAPELVRS
jgi:hypothetical protein